jgi:hypothetical protein
MNEVGGKTMGATMPEASLSLIKGVLGGRSWKSRHSIFELRLLSRALLHKSSDGEG